MKLKSNQSCGFYVRRKKLYLEEHLIRMKHQDKTLMQESLIKSYFNYHLSHNPL